MSVRKRVWLWRVNYKESNGQRRTKFFKGTKAAKTFADSVGAEPEEERVAWVVDYTDQDGDRHIKTFELKKDADRYDAKARNEVNDGTHIADSKSATVAEACDEWLASCRARGLKPSSIARNAQHVRLHIKQHLGRHKLSSINHRTVDSFGNLLVEQGKSRALKNAVMISLGSVFAHAKIGRNPVRERTRDKREDRDIEIPTVQEIKSIIKNATGLKAKASLMTLATTGLRASEFRGLRWSDLDLGKNRLQVRVRADFKNTLAAPKSKAGKRVIPLLPSVVVALKEWQDECPKLDGELIYVFPNGSGNIEGTTNIEFRLWRPAQLAAGVTKRALDFGGKVMRDKKGQPILLSKYTGLHTLRHFYASWCLSRKVDDGLELPMTEVQRRLGHNSIQLTVDTYGHLFPNADEPAELARADRVLLG